jgi:hypothetical protein
VLRMVLVDGLERFQKPGFVCVNSKFYMVCDVKGRDVLCLIINVSPCFAKKKDIFAEQCVRDTKQTRAQKKCSLGQVQGRRRPHQLSRKCPCRVLDRGRNEEIRLALDPFTHPSINPLAQRIISPFCILFLFNWINWVLCLVESEAWNYV